MCRFVPIFCTVLMFFVEASGQHLSSPKAIGLGAYTAAARDVSALDWNPAGLVFLRDWELRFNSYFEFRNGGNAGPYFGDGTIGKRFSDTHAFAVRYAPGLVREFRVATETISPQLSADGSSDLLRRHIEYSQVYSFGYARLISPMLSVGVTGRFINQRITDPIVRFQNDTLRISEEMYNEPIWSFDAGLLYTFLPTVTVGLTAKNLISLREQRFPDRFLPYSLNDRKYVRAGLLYTPTVSYLLVADYDTRNRGQVGHELKIGRQVSLRQGNYFNFGWGRTFEAISGGVGLQFHTMDIDISYLHFFDQGTRGRGSRVGALLNRGLEDLGYNQFTGNRLDVSVRLRLGRLHEPLARIEYVEIMSDVYPAAYQVHAYRPIAKVRVRNISQRPIESRVGFFVDKLMERATETRPYYMLPGEVLEIPVTAVFSEAIRSITNFTLQTAEIYVRATTAPEFDDRRQAQLAIHGRNDWNGDILTLRYFVTPEDPRILQFTRDVLNQHRGMVEGAPLELQQFKRIKALFDHFANMLMYVHDPRKTHNRVQYPAETLDVRGGDCDDMAVAFASMVASIGIASAFVDVVPPDEPFNAHVYLLVDSGIPPERADLISTNPKRYIIRRNEFGRQTVWIPLETTAIRDGFQTAWEIGAESYYNEGIIQGGIINGWVRIVDIPRM